MQLRWQLFFRLLSDNKFSKLPPEIVQFNLLKQLNVNNNRVTELPDFLSALVKLQTFNANCNHVSQISSALGKLKILKLESLCR